jgi:hypothetical protein
MKKTIVLMAAMLVSSLHGIAQDNKMAGVNENIYTALKPANPHPYVFGSQAEMDAKRQSKKDAVIAEIKANSGNPEKVKALREQLWRIENATVLKKDNNK